jgi:rubrerythrin
LTYLQGYGRKRLNFVEVDFKEVSGMAVWQCSKCGFEKEGRCKPQKCPDCGEKGTFVKKEEGGKKA